jgi:hypothetical protein
MGDAPSIGKNETPSLFLKQFYSQRLFERRICSLIVGGASRSDSLALAMVPSRATVQK